MKKFKIKKGDTVYIISGKDKGKKGEVMKVITEEDKLLVSGINMIKKSVPENKAAQQKGGFINKEAPVHISNAAIACKKKGITHSKVGFRFNSKGEKERYLKKTGDAL